MRTFFAGKRGIKRIVLLTAALVLAGMFIVANILFGLYAPFLHAFFAGEPMVAQTTEAKSALTAADEVVREIAEESMVLLKNDEVDGKPFLPRPADERFNLFGWGATDGGFLLTGGSGADDEANTKRRTLREAFTEMGVAYNEELSEKYSALHGADAAPREGASGGNAEESLLDPPASFYTQDLLEQAYGYSATAVAVLSRWGCENGGEEELVNVGSLTDGAYLELTEEERAMLNALESKNFRVIVVLNTCNPIELGFLEEYHCIKACLYAGIPGQSGAVAIPELLTGQKLRAGSDGVYRYAGKLSPSGRLSDTLAYDWQTHNPVYANAYAEEGSIVYQEGIYFGYKWYETAEEAGYYAAKGTSYDEVVQFPFGFGLSYTQFEQELVSVRCDDEEMPQGAPLEADKTYRATVKVTNKGTCAGSDVVQLYFSTEYVPGQIEKASIVLLAFDKTSVLAPGESEELTLTFTAYDMASYDAYDRNGNGFRGYELDPFEYRIRLMKNAHEPYPLPEGGTEESRLFTFSCEGIRFGTDPVTGKDVKNRFTGADAYADMPIDGDGGLTGEVRYLSRENAFESFPTERAPGPNQVAEIASRFKCVGETDAASAGFPTGEACDEFLLRHVDGTKAVLNELEGTSEEDTLVHNDALFRELADWDSPKWESLLNALSRDEIKDLIGRGGNQTVALESIGKPRSRSHNGTSGFNADAALEPKNECTVFPAESLMGCSWSRRLAYALGHMQGYIGEAMKIQGWYAPEVALHRSVYNSRGFEYYSEDGVLSGRLAAETVRGAKENNLYCYVKHLALSDSGEDPKDRYTWTTEQALRENYLKPFEICVKEGGANALMSGYNKLGAVWCGYNRALLTDILRGEWGFKGSVITDKYEGVGYMSDYDTALKAGNGLWLTVIKAPASITFGAKAVDRAAHEMVKGILYTYVDTYVTALEYREKVVGGELTDPFNVSLKVTITAPPHSGLFLFLWSAADIVLLLGMGACVLFLFLPREKKKQELPKKE